MPEEFEKLTLYAHRTKESNWETAEDLELGLSPAAAERFAYTGYELRLDCNINKETGEVRLVGVNNMRLAEPVTIN